VVDLIPLDGTEIVTNDAVYGALYKAAAHALADARTVSQVKSVRDQTIGLQTYARRAKNTQLEADTWELRYRAERKLGQMMALQRDVVGLATGGEHGGRGRQKIDGLKNNPSIVRPTSTRI
jgi:hypothetical protein